MRKTSSLVLATAGLAASLGAFAALPTDAQPFQVVVPNIKSGIDITLEGLYLQPTNTDTDYATTSIYSASGNIFNDLSVAGTSTVNNVDQDWNFGFRVGLGYTFEDSGNDVRLAWTHFNHTSSDSVTAPDNSVLTTHFGFPFIAEFPDFIPFFLFGGADWDNVTASSSVKTRLDSVDLDVGQYLDVGTRLRLRMFAGLRAARVTSDQTNTYVGSSDDVFIEEFGQLEIDRTLTNVEQMNSKFSGIGPRIGVDSSYHLGNCFGLVAHAAFALLVGETDTETNANLASVLTSTLTSSTFVDTDTDTFTITADGNSDDSTRVVPVLDAKLGLDYSYIFANESVLSIEAGYQVTQYIDAVDRFDGSVSLLGVQAVPGIIDQPVDRNNVFVPVSVDAQRTTSSVGFHGPYLSLNWKV